MLLIEYSLLRYNFLDHFSVIDIIFFYYHSVSYQYDIISYQFNIDTRYNLFRFL